MAGAGSGSGGGGGIGAWRLEGEGGKAKLGECGGRGGDGMPGTWDARVLGGLGVSSEGKYGEIIFGSKVWAGRMGEKRILQNWLVSGIEILKVLEWGSGTGGLSSGIERTRAKIWHHGSRDWS